MLCRSFGKAAPALVLGAALLMPAMAQAAPTITYVSTKGVNSGNCTLSSPCRGLTFAIGVAQDGGEVHVLDSGFYGAVAAVKKSITIVGRGNTVDQTAIIINANGITVSLRNLVLNGEATGANGVQIKNAVAVHIENCTVQNFIGHGLYLNGSDATVFVRDSRFANNGNSGAFFGGLSNAKASVDNSQFESNVSNGLVISFTAAVVSRSIASANGENGFAAAGSGELTLVESTASANATGLLVDNSSTARISDSVFSNNTTGIDNGGTVLTRVNNTVIGNTTETAGNALTVLAGS